MPRDLSNIILVKTSRESIGSEMLERYTGGRKEDFQPYILLTNFHKYVEIFADVYGVKVCQGAAMSCSHDPKQKISVVNYGVGSPVAALIIELLSFVKPRATLMLGMCGGLRDDYAIGEYFNPVAAIREEGTSLAYIPERCPSLSSFVIQRYVCDELEKGKIKYHTGVIHTTNVRFWEFKEEFKDKLNEERVQAIDMECATLFTVGFAYTVPVGALMLITDLPLTVIKTKEMAQNIFDNYSDGHLRLGVQILSSMREREMIGFGYQF